MILTLVMFPILVVMYVRLAHREEQEASESISNAWIANAACVLAFFPHLGRRSRKVWIVPAGRDHA